jgi:hypothetical protein
VTQPINDGGPAFPRTGADGHTSPQIGMTLRDYFAAAALTGLMADGGGASWDDDATHAYLCADAMIKAREAK